MGRRGDWGESLPIALMTSRTAERRQASPLQFGRLEIHWAARGTDRGFIHMDEGFQGPRGSPLRS